jgi:hypothetical protein
MNMKIYDKKWATGIYRDFCKTYPRYKQINAILIQEGHKSGFILDDEIISIMFIAFIRIPLIGAQLWGQYKRLVKNTASFTTDSAFWQALIKKAISRNYMVKEEINQKLLEFD